jgi:DNA-directed RNA polymerase alpha subunit
MAISARSANALRLAGFVDVSQVHAVGDDLARFRGIGRVSLAEIKAECERLLGYMWRSCA